MLQSSVNAVSVERKGTGRKDGKAGIDETDGVPAGIDQMNVESMADQSDAEGDVTPTNESVYQEHELAALLSESDEEYRLPRKKTRRTRKREPSASSVTRVTRSRKKN